MKQQFTISLTRLTFCFLLLILCIFNRYVTVNAVKKVLPKPNIPAVFAFGDSFLDPGNNRHLPLTLFKANFPPYGRDFKNKQPTGRFSNGLILSDFIVQALGIKKLLPAYMNSSLQHDDFLSGVSFASAGCGFDPITSRTYTVIPFIEQLRMFEEYIGKLRNMVGEAKANQIIENSAYLLISGTTDITLNYFGAPYLRKHPYSVDKFTTAVLKGGYVFVKLLYKAGARRIYMTNLPPVECFPSQRTLGGGPERKCAKDRVHPTKLYNKKLAAKLTAIGKKYSDAQIVLWDFYNIFLDIINNSNNYGFEVADKGCCGSGLIEVAGYCNHFSTTCDNATKYVFWDSFNPTERTHQLLSDKIVEKYKPHFY